MTNSCCRFSIAQRAPALVLACAGALFGILTGLCNLDKVGDTYMNQAQYDQAIPFYATMTTVASIVHPDHHRLADAFTNLGVCYLKVGQIADAAQAQETALRFRRITTLFR
jgi:hypothetical protein